MSDDWTPRDTFIATAAIVLNGRNSEAAWTTLRHALARLNVDEAGTPEARAFALNEWRRLIEQETA